MHESAAISCCGSIALLVGFCDVGEADYNGLLNDSFTRNLGKISVVGSSLSCRSFECLYLHVSPLLNASALKSKPALLRKLSPNTEYGQTRREKARNQHPRGFLADWLEEKTKSSQRISQQLNTPHVHTQHSTHTTVFLI